MIESWNNWSWHLRPMPVPWLISGHLEKFGKKLDKHKQDIEKLINDVDERNEQKIVDTYKKMGCVATVEP